MLDLLNPAVEISACEVGSYQLRDRRTGFHIEIANVPTFPEDATSGGAAYRTFDSLGFLGELSLAEVRLRQRPIRNQLQAELRNRELQELLNFATKHVPYYRQAAEIYDPAKIESTEQLSCLPRMRKSDIRGNFDRLLDEQIDVAQRLASGTLSLARTSGTTEERIQVLSDTTIDRVPPGYEAAWGVRHGDKVPKTAVLTSPICSATECRLGKSPMSERMWHGSTLFLNSVEDLFSAPDASIKNFSDELCQYNPEFILANPIYLHWFARRALELRLPLPKPELILSTYQYLSGVQKRSLEKIFSTRVLNTYTATELAGSFVGVECGNGCWHVREDHSIMEILSDEPAVFSDGVGQILVTTISNLVMPLVRYDIGDVGRLTDRDCPCELSDWQCFEFHGRRNDSICLKGRRLTTKQVDDVIAQVPGLDFYQCIQLGDSDLRIDAIPASGCALPQLELSQRVRDAFEVEHVQIHDVARLDPAPSMKFRLTVPCTCP